MKARVLALALFALCLVPTIALGQPVELGWQATDNPGGQGKLVAMDDHQNVYVVEQTADSNSILDVYDPFGDVVQSYSIAGVASYLAVDAFTGTAAVGVGNKTFEF